MIQSIKEKITLNQLDKHDITNTQKFSLQHNHLIPAKVTKIIDGDTIQCILKPPYHKNFFLFNIRMLDYDSPEIRKTTPQEKEQGLLAKSKLIHILENQKYIYVSCDEFDCFGRLLAHIFLDPYKQQSVNEMMKNFLQHMV